jgi:hypothetical protein
MLALWFCAGEVVTRDFKSSDDQLKFEFFFKCYNWNLLEQVWNLSKFEVSKLKI